MSVLRIHSLTNALPGEYNSRVTCVTSKLTVTVTKVSIQYIEESPHQQTNTACYYLAVLCGFAALSVAFPDNGASAALAAGISNLKELYLLIY